MAIWEEGSGPTTGWDQEAGMTGNANQENVATLAARATQAASNAEDSEDAAALSATAAAGSVTAAAGSAALAGQHKTAAETAQSLAETAQGLSESARDAALGYSNTASGHATTATTQASTATTQASTATTQAGIATTQAGIATNKASEAAASATSAAASYDSFDDRYLGSKANDPTVDNDGDALLAGALYFNSTTDVMKVYDGAAWVAAYVSIAGITLDDVTSDGNTTANSITVGGITSTGSVTASNLNTSNWDTAYGWGDHSAAGYLTSYIDTNNYVNSVGFATATGVLTLNREGLSALTVNLDGRYLTSYTETDPVFTASPAGGITATNISNWSTAYGWGNHAGLYPTYTGSGASGTWGINITGNAATATSATDSTKLPLAGGTMTGLIVGKTSSVSTIATANDTGSFSVRGNTSYPAVMSFHRTNAYAVNFGLSTSNAMELGGWSAGGIKHTWDMSGNYTAVGNVTAYSDARVKENVQTIDNALDKVCAMRGVTFDRTDEDLKNQMGVIAQEVLEVVPEVVDYNEEKDRYTVAYGNLVGLLIEAVKDLKAEVEALKRAK